MTKPTQPNNFDSDTDVTIKNDELRAAKQFFNDITGCNEDWAAERIVAYMAAHDRQLLERIDKEVIGKHLAGNKTLNRRIDEQRTALAKLKEDK